MNRKPSTNRLGRWSRRSPARGPRPSSTSWCRRRRSRATNKSGRQQHRLRLRQKTAVADGDGERRLGGLNLERSRRIRAGLHELDNRCLQARPGLKSQPMSEAGGSTDHGTDAVRATSGARHLGWIEDEGPDHAVDAPDVELGVVEVIGIIERDSLWLLDAGDDADLMPLAVELVDRVVSERIDEDVAGATDDHVIGRRQGRKANPGGVEDPECAALVGNEDPPVRIN